MPDLSRVDNEANNTTVYPCVLAYSHLRFLFSVVSRTQKRAAHLFRGYYRQRALLESPAIVITWST